MVDCLVGVGAEGVDWRRRGLRGLQTHITPSHSTIHFVIKPRFTRFILPKALGLQQEMSSMLRFVVFDVIPHVTWPLASQQAQTWSEACRAPSYAKR